MDTYLVNFATTRFDDGFRDMEHLQQMQNDSARRFGGIYNIISWNRKDLLSTTFYIQNKEVLDRNRGAGYWLWKPFIIHEQLRKVSDGDIVFYLDADIRFVADPQPLIDLCRQNNGFFFVELRSPNRLNRQWTKRDCFHYLDLDYPFYHNHFQTPSGLQIYEKTERTVAFVEELLHYTCDPRIVTDDPNVCGKPNLDGFVEHRHDQSVLSLLRLKYEIEGFRWPSEYGNHTKLPEYRESGEYLVNNVYSDKPYENSPYGTILNGITTMSNQDKGSGMHKLVRRAKAFIKRFYKSDDK